MPLPPIPDWAKLTEATYPHLTPAEREALTRIWATNYNNFHPLKSQVTGEIDPDTTFDPLATGSTGDSNQ
ncbi:MAG: hypothetical protein FJW36_23695 [Acidobacteria bacterium]|nr:hypothetical protein [Acidobacteriota bacterium]